MLTNAQDANECWTEVVRCLQRKVPSKSAPSTVGDISVDCIVITDVSIVT